MVGTSLGARVVQELALSRPELVRRGVAMAVPDAGHFGYPEQPEKVSQLG